MFVICETVRILREKISNMVSIFAALRLIITSTASLLRVRMKYMRRRLNLRKGVLSTACVPVHHNRDVTCADYLLAHLNIHHDSICVCCAMTSISTRNNSVISRVTRCRACCVLHSRVSGEFYWRFCLDLELILLRSDIW